MGESKDTRRRRSERKGGLSTRRGGFWYEDSSAYYEGGHDQRLSDDETPTSQRQRERLEASYFASPTHYGTRTDTAAPEHAQFPDESFIASPKPGITAQSGLLDINDYSEPANLADGDADKEESIWSARRAPGTVPFHSDGSPEFDTGEPNYAFRWYRGEMYEYNGDIVDKRSYSAVFPEGYNNTNANDPHMPDDIHKFRLDPSDSYYPVADTYDPRRHMYDSFEMAKDALEGASKDVNKSLSPQEHEALAFGSARYLEHLREDQGSKSPEGKRGHDENEKNIEHGDKGATSRKSRISALGSPSTSRSSPRTMAVFSKGIEKNAEIIRQLVSPSSSESSRHARWDRAQEEMYGNAPAAMFGSREHNHSIPTPSNEQIAPNTKPSSPTSYLQKTKKGLESFRKPISAMLGRRKSDQSNSELELPIKDPSIRGTRVHDFGAPRREAISREKEAIHKHSSFSSAQAGNSDSQHSPDVQVPEQLTLIREEDLEEEIWTEGRQHRQSGNILSRDMSLSQSYDGYFDDEDPEDESESHRRRSRLEANDTQRGAADLHPSPSQYIAIGHKKVSQSAPNRHEGEGHEREDRHQRAQSYQDKVFGSSRIPLTTEALRKVRRRSPSRPGRSNSSHSSRSSVSRRESDYKVEKSRCTRDTEYSRSGNDNDTNIKIGGGAVVRIGGAEIQCEDGEITFGNTSRYKPYDSYGDAGDDTASHVDKEGPFKAPASHAAVSLAEDTSRDSHRPIAGDDIGNGKGVSRPGESDNNNRPALRQRSASYGPRFSRELHDGVSGPERPRLIDLISDDGRSNLSADDHDSNVESLAHQQVAQDHLPSETKAESTPDRNMSLDEIVHAIENAPSASDVGKIWSLVHSSRLPHPSRQHKLLFYYHLSPTPWTQVTVTVQHNEVLEKRPKFLLVDDATGNVDCRGIYGVMQSCLGRNPLHPDAAGFTLSWDYEGELTFEVTDGTAWSVNEYPSAHMELPTLLVPKVLESNVRFESQVCSYLYRVTVDSKPLLRYDLGVFPPDDIEGVIRALARLRITSSHVARLEGVVVHGSSNSVKAILLEPLETDLPSRLKPSTPWNQRLIWARQIAEAFRDATAQGFVLASFSSSDIFIDPHDCAKIKIQPANAVLRESKEWYEATTSMGNALANVRRLGKILDSLASSGNAALDQVVFNAPIWFGDVIELCNFKDPATRPPADEVIQEVVISLTRESKRDDQMKEDGDHDSDSDMSLEDDTFDTMSVMSMETILTSASGYGILTQTATTVFVDLLYEVIDISALVGPKVHRDASARHGIRQRLKLLARGLSTEVPQEQHQDLGSFFKGASAAICSAILDRAALSTGAEKGKSEDANTPDQPIAAREKREKQPEKAGVIQESPIKAAAEPDTDDDISEAVSEESDAGLEEEDPAVDLRKLRDIVSESTAFKVFVTDMQELFCPTFDSKLKWMSRLLKDRAAGYKWEATLQETISELLYARPVEVWMEDTADYSWVDRVKDYIETSTSEEWDWWPLAPKTTMLRKTQAKLRWKCTCGETRAAVLDRKYARYIVGLKDVFAKGAASGQNSAPVSSSGARHTQAQSTGQHSGISRGRPPSGPTQSPYSSSSASTLVGSSMSAPNGKKDPSRYIPLMVSSERLLLNEIESQDLCNEGLIHKIRDAYHGAKGLRRWFTTMKFSHCEFFKFEEWSRGRYCERGKGIPPLNDTEYYYVPRPMDREPPISQHEFHDRFYNKVQTEDCHFGVPRQTCSDRDAVDRIPQVKKQVSVTDQKRQQFYGIVTREKKSGLMMIFYIALCSIPGTIFFFLWVCQWGHDSLQDASILLVLSWTLLGLLYAAQFI